MRRVNEKAQLITFNEVQKISLADGGFVLKGSVERSGTLYDKYCSIPKSSKRVIAVSTGLLLKFFIIESKRGENSILILTVDNFLKRSRNSGVNLYQCTINALKSSLQNYIQWSTVNLAQPYIS